MVRDVQESLWTGVMTAAEITEKSGAQLDTCDSDSSSPHTPPQDPVETHHCCEERWSFQNNVSFGEASRQEIDETRIDVDQTTAVMPVGGV